MAYVEKDKMKIYNAKQQEKFKRYVGKIEKDTAIEFDKKLKANKITFTCWLKNNIERYLKNF